MARRVACIFGTRPEAIKIAPVVRALQVSELFEPVVVVTAQHRTMLDQVLGFFDLVPDHDLDLLEPGQTLTQVTTRALTGLSEIVERDRPDAVVVQGDTTTTLAGALAGFYHRVPVAHVEAGLRTYDHGRPFPEEANRRLTAQLAALHLAPTRVAADNLRGEAVPSSTIVVTGNTVVDALVWALERLPPLDDDGLVDLDTDARRLLLVTAHRRESWGPALREIGGALADLARARDDLLIVFPIHRNQVVRDAILPAVDGLGNVRIVEPQSYGQFVHLLSRAWLVLTDSGGIQEEAPTLEKPVLVMRDLTERPEAVHAGSTAVVGTSRVEIVQAVTALLDDEAAYAAMVPTQNPYGDGRAAERCVAALASLFGLGPAPDEFRS